MYNILKVLWLGASFDFSRFWLAGAGRSLQERVRGAADEVSYEL